MHYEILIEFKLFLSMQYLTKLQHMLDHVEKRDDYPSRLALSEEQYNIIQHSIIYEVYSRKTISKFFDIAAVETLQGYPGEPGPLDKAFVRIP